jgi:hypothetical protein
MSEDNERQELTAESGAWLDVTQACAYLGITDRTLHRRVARGEIKRQVLPGRHSEFWIPGATRQETSSDTTPDERGGMLAPRDLLEAVLTASRQEQALLIEELTRSRQQLTEQAEEIGRLKAELEAERERHNVSADTDTARPPWWRRWFAP